MIKILSGPLFQLKYLEEKDQYFFLKNLFDRIQLKEHYDIMPADYDKFDLNCKTKLRHFCHQQKLSIVKYDSENIKVYFDKELIAYWKIVELTKKQKKFQVEIETWTSFEG